MWQWGLQLKQELTVQLGKINMLWIVIQFVKEQLELQGEEKSSLMWSWNGNS